MIETARRRLARVVAADEAQLAGLLKAALEELPPGTLPLGRTGPAGGNVDDSRITVTVRRCVRVGGQVHALIGVFYEEVIGGCSCGDEPAAQPAQAQLALELEADGTARFTLLRSD
jgi:hypothetical protein